MGNFLWSAVDNGIIVLWWKFSSFFVLSGWCRKWLMFYLGDVSYSFKVEVSPLYFGFPVCGRIGLVLPFGNCHKNRGSSTKWYFKKLNIHGTIDK